MLSIMGCGANKTLSEKKNVGAGPNVGRLDLEGDPGWV